MGFRNAKKNKKQTNRQKRERCIDDKIHKFKKAEQDADQRWKDWDNPDNTDLVDPETKGESDQYNNYLEYMKQRND